MRYFVIAMRMNSRVARMGWGGCGKGEGRGEGVQCKLSQASGGSRPHVATALSTKPQECLGNAAPILRVTHTIERP